MKTIFGSKSSTLVAVGVASWAVFNSFAADPPAAVPLSPSVPALRPVNTNRPVLVTPAGTANPQITVAPPANGAPLPPALPPTVRALPQPVAPGPVTPPNAIVWDSENKSYDAKPGEASAPFSFWLTNTSAGEVLINSARTSCGCTVAKLPEHPWHLAAGASGPIEVTVDLRGKRGQITKTVTVESSSGVKTLFVNVKIPDEQPAVAANGDRVKNLQMALADRQAVFKGDCVTCHVTPAQGKMGKELYVAACGICHDDAHRAQMVPDLKVRHPATAYDWKTWISFGRPGSLMPGFAKSEGGPLTDEQIASLVEYLPQAMTGTAQPAAPSVPVASPAFTVPSVPPPAVNPRPANSVIIPPQPPAPPRPAASFTVPPQPPGTLQPVATPVRSVVTVKPAAPAGKPDPAAERLNEFPFPK